MRIDELIDHVMLMLDCLLVKLELELCSELFLWGVCKHVKADQCVAC